MVVNHNLSAMFASRQINLNDAAQTQDIEKLSSGSRINRAGDDAAGLAVSEKMRSQIRGLNQAAKNTMDGVSFIQTTEGYLGGTTEALQRIRELAVQAANGIYTNEDRSMLQVETKQLVSEIDRIASQAQFNGLNMLTGRFAATGAAEGNLAQKQGGGSSRQEMWLHVGANMDQHIKLNVATMTANALGIIDPKTKQAVSLSNSDKANMTIGIVDTALQKVNSERANLGAYQNRLTKALGTINTAAENLQASESRIRDTDMAGAMVSYTKNNVLVQSSTAMLANANQKSQSVLQLLR